MKDKLALLAAQIQVALEASESDPPLSLDLKYMLSLLSEVEHVERVLREAILEQSPFKVGDYVRVVSNEFFGHNVFLNEGYISQVHISGYVAGLYYVVRAPTTKGEFNQNGRLIMAAAPLQTLVKCDPPISTGEPNGIQ